MPKFTAPKNFGGFTHGGGSYKADKKGIVTLPDGISVSVAASHGLIPADGTPEADTDPAPEDTGGAEA